jgi:hypothetical protein
MLLKNGRFKIESILGKYSLEFKKFYTGYILLIHLYKFLRLSIVDLKMYLGK